MADTPHLLFVDDEPALRSLMAERLTERGYDVSEADSGERALELLDQFAFDVVVTDLRLPGVDGTSVIATARERYPGIVALVITGYGTVKDAVEAMQRGASDFIAKPFQFDELAHKLQKALEQRRLTSENAYLRSQLEERYQFGGILGRSRPMQALFQLLETVARSNSTILVTGETGTGKEVVARAIHHNSPRRSHRFVALNCSAIPETLLEAELFGHVRGAFTGAVGARQGRFEQAHRGTLFLDEVGTMSPQLQMKLLRALQEREFERIGDNQTIKVDVRVIAATNSELAKMVADGTFREDLYYRLNVIPITLPPLRERRDDIPILVKHFLEKFAPGTPMQVAQGGMRLLMAYGWPGNVRQLENAIERAVALGAGRTEVEAADLPPELQTMPQPTTTPFVDFPEDGLDMPSYLARIEQDLIARALDRTAGNRNRAAELLRIKRTTLVEKLKRLDSAGGGTITGSTAPSGSGGESE
ncbi:MAG TPA: sigma-54 dependent transcriptional regulator [Vicinamibacterales bacterium]|jgi:DNA-binding NtrC family response regulator|nr:sigma-54 dependent transcriptional regulator [Vicinamibacterales bacterium]